jgi:hypothetical protein
LAGKTNVLTVFTVMLLPADSVPVINAPTDPLLSLYSETLASGVPVTVAPAKKLIVSILHDVFAMTLNATVAAGELLPVITKLLLVLLENGGP